VGGDGVALADSPPERRSRVRGVKYGFVGTPAESQGSWIGTNCRRDVSQSLYSRSKRIRREGR